jgi:hypothetical protein
LSRLERILKDFRNRLIRLSNSRERADELLAEARIGIRDCDLFYEATFLSGMAFFEDTLELLLLEMVFGRHGTKPGRFALVKARSREVLRQLMLGDDDYVRMLPLERAISVAARFMRSPVPFDVPDVGDRSLLADAVRVRNAIAHRGAFALNTFRRKVTGVSSLPSNRRYPGPFLRQVFRTAPAQTRHELYFSTLYRIASEAITRW